MDSLAPPLRPASHDPRVEEIDRAIAREDADRSARRTAHRNAAGLDVVGRLPTLPRLLRAIGATVLVAAAFTFMLQSWEHGDDVARYFHFLGFTVALAGAGFACGLRIRDEKGARTFLGLAAGAVPVHFTVLGAILYSQLPWLSGFVEYPGYAHFSAPDLAAALATTAVGLAVLAPVCWTAFLALARPEARRLTLAYLLSNAALLVPTRHPDVIGALALALLVGLVLFDRRVLAAAQALRTVEGRLVRGLMAVPFAILVGRTFNLYEPSSLFLAAVLASVAVGLFVLVPGVPRLREWRREAQYAAALPASAAWGFVVDALGQAFRLGDAAWLPLFCLPTAAILGAMSLRIAGGGAPLRRLASLVAAGGMTLELVLFPGVGASVGCLATAIVCAAYGYAAEQRGVFLTGLAALALGLLYHLRYAAELYALSPWGSLALLGTATVFAAALLERHHRALAVRLVELRGRMARWRA